MGKESNREYLWENELDLNQVWKKALKQVGQGPAPYSLF